jgi:hypothetical protein
MVEHKHHCLYEEANPPPMVHATFANDDVMMINAATVETTLLLSAVTAEPSAPCEDLDNHNHNHNNETTTNTNATTTPTTATRHQPPSTPPPSYRNVVHTPPTPRDFTPVDNQGGGRTCAPTTTSTTTADQQMRGQEEDPAEHGADRMVASGTAGAVIGLLVGGPFLAAIAGFGSAYATQKDGVAGDTSRALGEVALTVKEKAYELNTKHHIVDKSKHVAGKAWIKAQEQLQLDNKHAHILEQLKDLVLVSWQALVEFVGRYRLLEKGVDGVGRGLEYIVVAGSRVVVSGRHGAGTTTTEGSSTTDENSTFQTNTNEHRSERR